MDLKRSNFFILIFLCILCFSCDEKRVFDEYQALNGKWKQEDVVRFTFEQNDTINPYNLFLNIRNNNDYPFSNLFVTVSLKQPDSLVKIDTLEYAMANPDGSLMGEGFSDVKESKLWYQENFVFKQKGTGLRLIKKLECLFQGVKNFNAFNMFHNIHCFDDQHARIR